MVDTSSLSGILSASGFTDTTSGSGNTSPTFDATLSSDSDNDHTSLSNSRIDTSSLTGIEALSRQPSTSDNLLNRATGLDTIAGDEGTHTNGAMETLDVVPLGTSAAGQSLANRGYNIQVDNPILIKTFESTTSAWNGQGGFTGPALERLHNAGIETRVNNVPAANSITKAQAQAQGISSGTANTINGAAAEQSIVDRYRNRSGTYRIKGTPG